MYSYLRDTTLDRFVQRMGLKPPLLLKVDVEGHERAFFAGAQQTIATYKPDMICEVAILYKRSNPFMFLKEHGYYFYKITNRGLELSETVLPVIDGHFFFPNYFMSTKTPDVVAGIFDRVRSEVASLDLKKTSKYFGEGVFPQAREES